MHCREHLECGLAISPTWFSISLHRVFTLAFRGTLKFCLEQCDGDCSVQHQRIPEFPYKYCAASVQSPETSTSEQITSANDQRGTLIGSPQPHPHHAPRVTKSTRPNISASGNTTGQFTTANSGILSFFLFHTHFNSPYADKVDDQHISRSPTAAVPQTSNEEAHPHRKRRPKALGHVSSKSSSAIPTLSTLVASAPGSAPHSPTAAAPQSPRSWLGRRATMAAHEGHHQQHTAADLLRKTMNQR